MRRARYLIRGDSAAYAPAFLFSLPPVTFLVQALNQPGGEITSDQDSVRALLLRDLECPMRLPADLASARGGHDVGTGCSRGKTALRCSSTCSGTRAFRTCNSLFPVSFCSHTYVPETFLALAHDHDHPSARSARSIRSEHDDLKVDDRYPPQRTSRCRTHAVSGFWNIWKNTTWQVKPLDSPPSLPNDTSNFVTLPGRRCGWCEPNYQSSRRECPGTHLEFSRSDRHSGQVGRSGYHIVRPGVSG